MPFVADWATRDLRSLVHLSSPVLEVFERYVQRQAGDPEAGGVLLGTVHGAHVLVTEATAPSKRDRRHRYLFERMPFRHRSIALARWKASGGRVRYLGEWHTHPQDHPIPSRIDLDAWAQLACGRLDGRPALTAIVGRRALHVELTTATPFRCPLSAVT